MSSCGAPGRRTAAQYQCDLPSRQLGRSMPEGEAIPHVTQTNFVALLIGYLVLVAGNLFEGV